MIADSRLLCGTIATIACIACGPTDDASNPASGGAAQAGNGGSNLAGGGSGGAGTSAGGMGGTAGSGKQGCSLEEVPANPTLTLSGTACGQPLQLTAHAGTLLRLSRASLTQPIEQVTSFLLKDDPSNQAPNLPGYFSDFGFVFSVGLATGPELKMGTSTHAVESGLIAACQFGSLAFAASDVDIDIKSLSNDPQRISVTLSKLKVAGFSKEYGRRDVPTCEGEVMISVEGAYQYDPG